MSMPATSRSLPWPTVSLRRYCGPVLAQLARWSGVAHAFTRRGTVSFRCRSDTLPGPANYVKARPILNDVAHFDAGLFGYSPRDGGVDGPSSSACFKSVPGKPWNSSATTAQRYAVALGGVFAGAKLNSYFTVLCGESGELRRLPLEATLAGEWTRMRFP